MRERIKKEMGSPIRQLTGRCGPGERVSQRPGLYSGNSVSEEDSLLYCICKGNAASAAAAAAGLLRNSVQDDDKIQKGRLGKKSKRTCALCELKVSNISVETKVTKKRLAEWRSKHGVPAKEISPYALYDYVNVCRFCAQFFNVGGKEDENDGTRNASKKKSSKHTRGKHSIRSDDFEGNGDDEDDEDDDAVNAMIFAEEDRSAPSLATPYFQSLFSNY